MKKISTLAVLLTLVFAPVVLAGDSKAEGAKAEKASCAKTCAHSADAKKDSHASCKKSDKCTAEEKAKCAAQTDAKPEAKEAAKAAPKS